MPDTDLRDNETIPLPAGLARPSDLPKRQCVPVLVDQAERYLRDEIHPYANDAWIDHTKTKIGYEIPFTRHFYQYTSPRPLAHIDADLADTERRIRELLGGLKR